MTDTRTKLPDVICQECRRMFRDFASEGEPHCRCGEKVVQAMKDEMTGRSRAALASPSLTSRWQPIETAPMDEEVLMGWWVTWPERKWEQQAGLYGSTKGGWNYGQATHWQPLPPAPATLIEQSVSEKT